MTRLLLLLCLVGCTKSDPQQAVQAATAFAADIPNVAKVSCVETDSDGDGYCACTVLRKQELSPIALECGCERLCVWNCARGCRVIENVKVRRLQLQ